jgi:aryl-alcohol dehydrogenase-like predicted oxidoreductase
LARGKLARPYADDGTTARAKTDAFGKTLFVKTTDIDGPVIARTKEIATARGVPMAQVAMAWLLRKPAVTSPIFGATKPQHLEDAIAAVSLTLSDEEMGRLDELYQPHPATEGYS